MASRWASLAAVLLLGGCERDIAVSPPEHQRVVAEPEALGAFVRMNQANAEKHFVSGLYHLEDNAWRWAARRAVLRLRLGDTKNLKFVMKFAVPIQVYRHSGPVQVSVLINGRQWMRSRYENDGIYEIEEPAPAEMLKPDSENTLTIEIDKPLPADGSRPEMGFILVHAGFQPAS